MKRIFLLVIGLLFINCKEEQIQTKCYLLSYPLYGNVKTMKQEMYSGDNKFGKWQNNNRLESVFHNIDELSGVFMLDDKDNFSIHFDIHGNEEKEYWDNSGTRIVYKFGDDPSVASIESYNRDSVCTDKATLHYDEKHNLLEALWYKVPSGKYSSREEFIYNEEKRLKEYYSYGSNKEVTRSIKYFRDDKGNIVKQESTGEKDRNNNFIVNYTYDEKNIKTSIEIVSDQNKPLFKGRCEYEFDLNGNWTKELLFIKDEVVITTRDIEYHTKNN